MLTYTLGTFTLVIIGFSHSQTTNFILILLSLLFCKINKKSFIRFMVSYMLCMLTSLSSDALVGFFLLKILKISYYDFLDSYALQTICSTFIMIICIFISYISNKYINKYVNKYNLSNKFKLDDLKINKILKRSINLLIVIFCVINIFFRFLSYMPKTSKEYSADNISIIYIVSVMLVLIFLFILLYFLRNLVNISYENKFIDKENKQLKEYTDMLEKMSTDLRKFKHDYVNILYTLGDFINTRDISGLKDYYFNDLLPESKNIVKNDKHITLLKNIKITPLKALISSKLLAAQSQEIEISAEVLEIIEKLSIKTIDICRIVGIFLDNAAEAAILCEKKFIHFAMIKTDGNIIIIIINSCPEDIPPVFQLYKKNFSTKGTNRGIGLSNVKDIIDKSYKNVLLNTTVKDGVFKQELIIKNCNSD